MDEKLCKYVDDLFADAAPTKTAVELKEEMIQNLHDKYNDLISDGKTQEGAYNIAVAGIGDVSDLLDELSHSDLPGSPYQAEHNHARAKAAMLTSIAVMAYILSPLPLTVLALIGYAHSGRVGVPIMFVLIAAATGVLVYSSMTKPRYLKSSDTMIEDFREWQSDAQRRKSLRRAISAALWSVTLALYMIISFATFAWALTWIIFLLAIVAEAFINVFFTLRK